jgi:hypothetical protein
LVGVNQWLAPGGRWQRLSFETQRPATVSHMTATDEDFDDLGFFLNDPRVSFAGVAGVGVTGRHFLTERVFLGGAPPGIG